MSTDPTGGQRRQRAGALAPPPVRCRECQAVITTARLHVQQRRGVLCLGCLSRHPEAPFADRVVAFRLARGLTRVELARRTGFKLFHVGKLEATSRKHLAWTDLVRLVRVLGIGLLTLGLDAGEGGGPATPPAAPS